MTHSRNGMRHRALLVDLALGVAAAACMVAGSLVTGDDAPREAGAWAQVAAAAVGAWSAVARRRPRLAVLAAPVSAVLAFGTVTPAFSMAIPLAVPLYYAGRRGHLWWGVAAVGFTAVLTTAYRLLFDAGVDDRGQILLWAFQEHAFLVVLVLLGETVRSRSVQREESELRLQVARADHELRMLEQRLRTARDLHDVLAHTLTVVNIQAGVAVESLDRRPDRSRDALGLIATASREAMADLRGTIAVLRENGAGESAPGPAPGLGQLDDLVTSAKSAGLDARLDIAGEGAALRPAIELALYRVAQESLTNVLRHAAATSVRVTVHHEVDAVRLTVEDDGVGPNGHRLDEGFGLQGMTERVEALGGRLTAAAAGPDGRGFRVAARLPRGGSR